LRTLDRYIFREVAVTWVAVTGVLLVILLSNQLARVLSQAAANNFPRGVVLSLIGLTSAGYLTVIVPIGFFLAIMLALGRLYHESEMAAIQSCGVGPAGLFRPIAVLGAAIAALLVWLSFWAIPGAAARAQEIRTEALREAQFGLLEPGRFRTFGAGNVVFYAERVDENGILHNVNVFVDHSQEEPAPRRTVREEGARDEGSATQGNATAGSATQGNATAGGAAQGSATQGSATQGSGTSPGAAETSERARPRAPAAGTVEIWVATRAEQRGAGQADQTFILYDGERYEGVPGSGEFRIIEFREGGIPIRLAQLNGRADASEAKPTAQLWRSSDPKDRAELQWRLSTPVLALTLMVLAVPLARLRPRQGRFGRIGIAILAYFVYSQLLAAARAWVEGGVVPAFVGLWWVHAIALCAGLWLLAREYPRGNRGRVAAVA